MSDPNKEKIAKAIRESFNQELESGKYSEEEKRTINKALREVLDRRLSKKIWLL